MRFRKWLVFGTLVVCLIITSTIVFADVVCTIQYTAQSGELNLRCQGLYGNTAYSLALLKSGTENWSQGNLVYLNQVTSSAGGELNISFIHVQIPECTIYLGGPTDDGASPLVLGTVNTQASMTLPAALTRIEEEAFANSQLSIVYIGERVQYIGDRAFIGCNHLLEIHIPNSVTEFGDDVFADCGQVVIVCSQESAAWQYAVANGLAHRTE